MSSAEAVFKHYFRPSGRRFRAGPPADSNMLGAILSSLTSIWADVRLPSSMYEVTNAQ